MGHKNFPEDREFSIGLRDTNLVLDVEGGHSEPGTPIIIWTAKNEDNANQKWIYEDKQLRNKQTGLVLTVPQLQTNELANQQYASGSGNQKFEYYDYTISAADDENLVLGIVGSTTPGGPLALIRRDNDSEKQQWEIIY